MGEYKTKMHNQNFQTSFKNKPIFQIKNIKTNSKLDNNSQKDSNCP